MWLKKGDELRKLKFHAPSELSIETGFPVPTSGMQILDVSDRGMENISISVSDFEASQGVVSFYADAVEELK